MSVIQHDFGKKKRLVVRRFRQLLGLDIMHEEALRKDPVPYLERASERIYRLRRALFEAAEVARAPAHPAATEQLLVNAAEYQRLLKCRDIVLQALTDSDVEEII